MFDNLVPGGVKAAMKDSGASSADLWMVPIEDIKVKPEFNVRGDTEKYLAHVEATALSIEANGFRRDKALSIIVVKEGDKNVIYLHDGHTRLRSTKLANSRTAKITHLPCITAPAGTSQEDLTIGLVIANSGEPLTPIEKAAVCKRLVGYGMAEAEIARRLSFTKQYVTDLLLLIGAPKDIRTMVETGQVSAANAVTAVKTHGDKASSQLAEKLATAKAEGKTKVTQASFKPKVSVVDLGVGWLAKQNEHPSTVKLLIEMLSHVSGVETAVIDKKLTNATASHA